MEIDLRDCEPGDKLKSIHGTILTYVGTAERWTNYDHEVRYPDGSLGTRTHEGHTYRNKRQPEDEDIAEILGQ